MLVAGPVTITLTVGVHPAVPDRREPAQGFSAPCRRARRVAADGVFQGAATSTAGRYVSTVTISYKGVPVDRKLVVTVKAATFVNAPAGRTSLPDAGRRNPRKRRNPRRRR